ncbi:MAG: 16S rRNA (cytosine(967)-C(5))-methyltransferase RsmB [Legionella sp.]|nr:16S rRNA (cytosine(967)-C(5))-methyltransferase RsmB [Legionella sp.]
MKKTDRLIAFKILLAVIQDKSSLSQQMGSSTELSAFTKELCFGVCRHFFRLEAMAFQLMKKRPKEMEVWVAVLMGLYQLHYMNQADYAVVKETVDLLNALKKNWAKALVNAVLRNFCRQSADIMSALDENSAFTYGQPPWLLEQLKIYWPNDWACIAKANDAHPPMTLRVNTNKISRADYIKKLEQSGLIVQISSAVPTALTLAKPCDVISLPGFDLGEISVQDAAAQLAATLLDLKPGLRVLDACCAPGGKTCHILESQPQLKECVALDVDAKRLSRVKDNLHRLNLKAHVLQGDANAPDVWWDGQLFDRILLDAPCSATGVIRRHSDIKLLRKPEDIAALALVQKNMLNALWPLLAPGGLLVYATCSVMPAENEQSIHHFLQLQPDCEVLEIQGPWGQATGHGRQILPGEQGMDGFFYSVLLKSKG